MARVKDLIANVLVEAGIEYVFGLPGGGTMEIFDALYERRDAIRTILVRHEHGAAIMADAYARATGKPAVILGQGAFLGSNAAFGIMEAYVSGSPMVILTDTSDGGMPQHPANQSVTGDYGSPDLVSIFRAMTKYTTLAATPKEAVIGLQLAIKHAISGRPGPAAVVLRTGAIGGEVDTEKPPFIHPTQGYLSIAPPVARPDDVARAADLLARARRPVLIAGNGVHLAGAHAELRDLAELLGMPVATSYKGKSAIPENHPLALGMVGVFGQAVANQVVAESDLVLVVGAKLTPQETLREKRSLFDPARQTIIQIDIDPRNVGWTFPVALGLVGDARETLREIVRTLQAMPGATLPAAAARLRDLDATKHEHAYYDDPALFRESTPVLPQRLVRVLQETLDPGTLLALDAGNNRAWMCHLYQSQQAGTFFCPGGLAGMGWALPAALALKLARPDRPVVGVVGDGGFMMSIHALATAVQYDLPVVYVVMNDSSLGMVRQHQKDRVIAAELGTADHARIAQAFGAYGVQVRDSRDLSAALRDATAAGRPAVVDVIIDRAPAPDQFRFAPRAPTET